MDIVTIYEGHLYSIQYDEKDENEFDRLFDEWNDVEAVLQFMVQHKAFLKNKIWSRVVELEDAARQVLNEAEYLENRFDELNENTIKGKIPDFDSHFKYLDGPVYYSEWKQTPMKSYGNGRPSFLRIYAIKLEPNVYVVTGGGIKLADSIQNSPDLQDHVFCNIKMVRDWLKRCGITDHNDI